MSERNPAQIFATWVLILVVIWAGFNFILYSITEFPGVQNREYIPRVKGDQRTLAIALETYFLDHKSYPAWSVDPSTNANGGLEDSIHVLDNLPTFRLSHGTALATLTTPLSYISMYFADPFAPVKGASFCYWSNNDTSSPGYIIWSPGRDKIYDITLENVAQIYNPREMIPSPDLLELTYDPSNGTNSRGDVYRYKQ